jgi:hypothetical protein
MRQIDRFTARNLLRHAGAWGLDFHALPSESVERLLSSADAHGYRAPKNRNGSRARYWHAYLSRRARSLEE